MLWVNSLVIVEYFPNIAVFLLMFIQRFFKTAGHIPGRCVFGMSNLDRQGVEANL